VLADDMGLGKTLQTIAHLVAEKEAGASIAPRWWWRPPAWSATGAASCSGSPRSCACWSCTGPSAAS
jgi:hypothetical protein